MSKIAKTGTVKEKSALQLIDERMKEIGDWRGETLAKVRWFIKEADPEIVEKWKGVKPTSGTAVWSHNGGICNGETYKDHIKLTFFKGASLQDSSHLFNQPGTVRRSIDIHEGEKIDEEAFKALIRAAVEVNKSKSR